MATPEEVKKAIQDFTFEDIQAFFAEKVKVHTCPTCLTNKWQIVGGKDHLMSLMALEKGGGFAIPPPSVPIAAIACNNCGYIRSHALGVLAQWKDEKTK
jgi:hypothetical protein